MHCMLFVVCVRRDPASGTFMAASTVLPSCQETRGNSRVYSIIACYGQPFKENARIGGYTWEWVGPAVVLCRFERRWNSKIRRGRRIFPPSKWTINLLTQRRTPLSSASRERLVFSSVHVPYTSPGLQYIRRTIQA